MPSSSGAVRRGMQFVLCSRGVVPILSAAFAVIGIVMVLTDYAINDEGMLTHYWASWLRRDFAPMFFFQKTKPVVCALYAVVSAFGAHATMIAHVVVAATALPMLAAVARSLELRLPNVPAFVVALSPLYFYGAAAGISNVDGVVGIVLALYLLCVRKQPPLAGLVLGMLPWVRYELAVFGAVMAVYAVVTPAARSMLVTMATFPIVYAVSGAVYHADFLWMLHYPPAAPFNPQDPLYTTPTQLLGFRHLLEPAAALTPAAGLAAALPLGRLHRIERAMLVYAGLVVLAMNVLPVLHIGNFGASPRYMLLLLPALALMLGRALEPWWEEERPGNALLLPAAVVAVWVATRQQHAAAAAGLVAAYALVLIAAWSRAATLAVGAVAVLLAAGPLLPLRTDVGPPWYLHPMYEWLRAHPEHHGARIYTNAQLLGPYLARRLPRAEIYYILGADMMYESDYLINVDNGQYDRIAKLSAAEFYAKQVLPPFEPDDLPADALLVLRVDTHRLGELLPGEVWSSRLETVAETPSFRIARLKPEVANPGS